MSKGNFQTSVGAIGIPENGIANTLLQIGKSQGDNAKHDDKLKAEADRQALAQTNLLEGRAIDARNLTSANTESARRHGIATEFKQLQEDRQQKEADYVTSKRDAKMELGRRITGGLVPNHKFKLEANSQDIQDKINNSVSKLTEGQKAFETYFSGEQNSDTLKKAMESYDKNYLGSADKGVKANNRNDRNRAYVELSTQLRLTKNPELKKKLIADMSAKMFGKPLADIQNDVDTGAYLYQGEKQNRIINSLSPELRGLLNRSDILGELGDTVTGMTRKEAMTAERQYSKDRNVLGIGQYKADMSKYSASVKSAGKFTGKSLGALTKTLDGLDIGYNDNADAVTAANEMLDRGDNPEAIAQVIVNTVKRNTNMFGADFITKTGDKDAYQKMMNRSKALSTRMDGGGVLDVPERFNVVLDSTPEQIRSNMFKNRKSGRLLDYLPKSDRQQIFDSGKAFDRNQGTYSEDGVYNGEYVEPELDVRSKTADALRAAQVDNKNFRLPTSTPLVEGNFDVPGSNDWLKNEYKQSARRVEEQKFKDSRTILDEAKGVRENITSLIGSASGAVGHQAGSVLDIGNKLLRGVDSNNRGEFAEAMSFFQIDENSSYEAKRNHKDITETLKWLPPNGVSKLVKNIKSGMSPAKAIKSAKHNYSRKNLLKDANKKRSDDLTIREKIKARNPERKTVESNTSASDKRVADTAKAKFGSDKVELKNLEESQITEMFDNFERYKANTLF